MNPYSTYQLQAIFTCIIAVAALLALAPLAKRNGAPTPVIGIGLVVAVTGIVGFTLTIYISGDSVHPLLNIATKYIKDLPITIAVTYASLLQASYYSVPHNLQWIRRSLEISPYVIWGGFIVTMGFEGWDRPPLLTVTEPLSLSVVAYNSFLILPLIFYGSLTAFIFLRTTREPLTFAMLRNRRQRNIQNSCGVAVMGAFT